MTRLIFRALSPLVMALVSGCTFVTTEPGGRISSVKPGVLTLSPAPGAGVLAYRARGAGIVAGRSGPTLGWAREDVVVVYDIKRCGVIIFDQPKNPEAMDFWRKLAGERTDICIAGETK